jgi:hypothetical protein
MLIYRLGMNKRPIGGSSSETYSHHIDMIIIIIIMLHVLFTFVSVKLVCSPVQRWMIAYMRLGEPIK